MTAAICAGLGVLVGAFMPDLVRRMPDRPTADGVAPAVSYSQVASRRGLRATLAGATALVWGLLGGARAGEPDLPAFLVLGALGVALGAVDLATRRLPDVLTLSALGSGAVLLGVAAAVDGSWAAYGRGWLGSLALFAAYLALAFIRPADLGMGDVKLAAPLGLYLGWLGWGHLVLGAFLGFLVGGLTGLALLAAGRATRRSSVPFGPSMLVGALVAVLWGRPLVDAYLGR